MFAFRSLCWVKGHLFFVVRRRLLTGDESSIENSLDVPIFIFPIFKEDQTDEHATFPRITGSWLRTEC